MNKKVLVIVAIFASIGLFAGGFFFSQVNAQSNQPGWMMGNWNGQADTNMMDNGQFGSGMMGNGQYNSMMGNGQSNNMMGMMMSSGMMDGQYGSGMMGNYDNLANVEPLTIVEAETAVTNYLATLNNENLSLSEIMIFDNHAYAQIMNAETGQGAFEVLVDPTTRNVFPEPGPNMMWNTDYGMMSGGNYGMMGSMMNGQYGFEMMGGGQYHSVMMGEDQYSGMMGNFSNTPDTVISVSPEQAIAFAQEYLDDYLPGKTADTHADTFPGYYTVHVLEDGETIGMLSVNAYSGQVFFHHWHGAFIEMTGEEQG